jgi:hypothetical protein
MDWSTHRKRSGGARVRWGGIFLAKTSYPQHFAFIPGFGHKMSYPAGTLSHNITV